MPVIRDGRRVRTVFEVDLIGQPSGPVSTRHATDAERAAWSAPAPPSPLERRAHVRRYSHQEIVDRAHRGGEVMRERTAAQRGLVTLVDPVITEERAMQKDPVGHALSELESSAHEALGSWERRTAADDDWQIDRKAVAGALDAARAALGLDTAAAGPEPATVANGLTPGQRRVLEALVRHEGDRDAVAAELGQKRASVDTATAVIRQLSNTGRATLAPAEWDAVAARRAR